MEDKVNAGDAGVEAAESNAATPVKKTSKTKVKLQQKKPSRPPTSEMVTTAIKELKDRKGSSLQAIKKYIVATYKVDVEKVAPFIRRYLKTAVSSGTVVQTKGKGASGSFKLWMDKPNPKVKKVVQRASKPEPKKAVSTSNKRRYIWVDKKRKPSTMRKTATKKAVESPKKQPAQKKAVAKPAGGKTKATVAARPPSKAKKTAKAPAAKTKTPKPKKTTTATKTVKAAAKK